MGVGDRIRQARKLQQMTLKQLGEAVGVTGAAIAAWETGRNLPDAVMLRKLAVALNVSMNWLGEMPARDEDPASDVDEFIKEYESLSYKDRQTLMSVLHALKYQSMATGADVIPRAEGNQKNRQKR